MSRCPACGSECDGDCCDSRCADILTERKKWAGREPCERCVEVSDQNDWEPATVGELCSMHAEEANEAAYERSLEDFYGGSSHQTDRERMDAAYTQRAK